MQVFVAIALYHTFYDDFVNYFAGTGYEVCNGNESSIEIFLCVLNTTLLGCHFTMTVWINNHPPPDISEILQQHPFRFYPNTSHNTLKSETLSFKSDL